MAPKSAVSPPDGGWGWVTVGVSALQFAFWGGVLRSFSLLHEQLRVRFNASASEAAVVYSLNCASNMLFAPLAAALYGRFSARQVAVLGALMVFTGVLLTGFAPSLHVVYITYGILAGLGTSLIATMKFVVITSWFNKRVGKAVALSMLTDGFGGMFMSPLISFCLSHYGFAGTFLIISGLCLHGLVCAATLVLPKGHNVLKQSAGKIEKVPHEILPEGTEDAEKPNDVKYIDEENCVEGKYLQYQKEYNIKNELTAKEMVEMFKTISSEENEIKTLICSHQLKEPIGMQQTKVEMEYLTPLRNAPDTILENGDFEIAENQVNNDIKIAKISTKKESGSTQRFLSCLDVGILHSSQFLLFTLLMVTGSLMGGMVMTHTAGMARERAMTTHQVATLLSVIGATVMLARILAGVLFDIQYFKAYRQGIFGLFGMSSGVILWTIPLTSGMVAFCVMAVCNTMLYVLVTTQESVILNTLVSRQQYPSAMGLSRFFRGCGILLGPIIGGLLKDVTGDYNSSFYLGGGLFFCASALFELNLLRPRLGRIFQRNHNMGT